MKFRFYLLFLFFSFFIAKNNYAQAPVKWTSADIHEAIKKLNFLGSALYIAAHPDDENTRMIAYLANHKKAETAYLSLTRGDGGQNLIGTEIRELLGVIRTQELLAARRLDGGKQFFSRANDFGYSKSPEETIRIWNEEAVLADVVWTIRNFQPDIIINRFQHETTRKTHGHHTASAMLSYEAFDLVGDKKAFPEQLEHVAPWQPTRLYMNTSWWFYGSREKFAKADKSKMLSVDVGVYYPNKGLSNTEIAAYSRSQHKCQGMGNTPRRGEQSEYLEILKGEMPENKEDLFDGINTTWSRVAGGVAIQRQATALNQHFKYDDPAASIPQLLKTYALINNLEDGYWKRVKLEECKEIIKACLGLFAEASADDYSATRGEDVELKMEFINRSNAKVFLEKISYLPVGMDSTMNLALNPNEANEFYKTITLPETMESTNPYWLNDAWDFGMYTVNKQKMRGMPETARQLKVAYIVNIEGISIPYVTDVIYKSTDPVAGEVYRPFEVIPPVFANITDNVYVFGNDDPKNMEVIIKSGKANVSGVFELKLPKGWRSEPAMAKFDLALKGAEETITFEVFPPQKASEGEVSIAAKVDGKTYTKALNLIEYDHIPTQTVLLDASAKVVKVDLQKRGEKVAYIMGAGDEIPASLEQIGYQVDILDDAAITTENLKNYDALIIGIRAYNTSERIKFHQAKLLDYVKQGGTMIVQYNTSHRLKVSMDELGPYPLNVSRDRVSVEEAAVRFLQADHPILNYPNKITTKDFDNWVQERGLYFPNEWDDNYQAILSSNDPNEPARDGGLLVAKYGKGHYIYTGYSWFRELPAGVPGAYRLFTNMISIGK